MLKIMLDGLHWYIHDDVHMHVPPHIIHVRTGACTTLFSVDANFRISGQKAQK